MNEQRIVTLTLNPAIDETVSITNFAAGKVNRVKHSEQHAGGKGINVAASLVDYGFSVCATGFLGRENDALFTNMFATKGIIDQFIRIDGLTRVGIKITDHANKRTTEINYPGLAPQEGEISKLLRLLETLSNENEWFVLSGSIPLGVSTSIYADIIALLKKRKKRVVLDTSGKAFTQAIAQSPDVIKPNIDELSEYAGKTLYELSEITEISKKLIRSGISLVIVSMAEKGALFVTKDESLLARPPKVRDLVSSVGAGDAMVSGTLCGLIENLSLKDIAALATAFSVSAIQSIIPGIHNKDVLNDLAKRVTIKNI